MSLNARQAALSALSAFRQRGARPDIILSNFSKQNKLDGRDMSLAANITNGVLQNAAYCDYYIGLYSNTPVSKLEPVVLDILRISVYQMLFLTRVPVHAAVSEGVELTKKNAGRAAGLVNAILRKIAAGRDSLPLINSGDIAQYFSIRYSHPKWLVKRLIADFGDQETEAILNANNTEPAITVQVNKLKVTSDELLDILLSEGVTANKHPFIPDALVLSETGALEALDSFRNGLFFVQDAAARLAVIAAEAEPDMCLLDVCSAPGGKSFASAVAMENSGEIRSFDIHENKISQITSGAKRLGISIISASKGDARVFTEELSGIADVVVADVPCSGFGVIRKKPEIRYKKEEEIVRLPEIQLSILNNVSKYVKPGGTLIYSTCTILKEENQEVVSKFLADNDRFSLQEFELPEPFGHSNGMITILPHHGNTDGFFICRLKRIK